MSDKPSNPNMEWKKGSVGEQEKITLKTNVAKAVEYNAQKDNLNAAPAPLPADLPKGLKRIRNKIKGVFDEEEEDEGQIVVDPLMQIQGSSSLINALHDDEKKFLKQQENTSLINQRLEVEKISTINLANNMARQAGFKGLKAETVRQSVMENNISPNKLNETLKKEFKNELKINNKWNKLSDKDLVNLMEGVNKIKSIGGKESLSLLRDMDVKEVVAAGKEDKNDMKIARTICEKTGRKECHSKDKREKFQAEKALVKNQSANKNFAQERERS